MDKVVTRIPCDFNIPHICYWVLIPHIWGNIDEIHISLMTS